MQNEAFQEARTTTEIKLERYTELFDFAPTAYLTLAADGCIHQANFRSELLLGIERGKIVGRQFTQHVSGEYRQVFKRFLETVFAGGEAQRCEITLQFGNLPVWVSIEATVDAFRETCFTSVLDISEQKLNEQELQLAATIYLALGEAIMVADGNNQIISVNEAFTQLTGYTNTEAIGQPTSLLKSGRQNTAFYQGMWTLLNTTGHWQGEIWNRRKNGEEFIEWLSISTIYTDTGEVARRVAMFSDITDKKLAQDIIRKHANYDPLTGLPNRRLFYDRLQQAIKKAKREDQKLAILFLDLDQFKDINDTLGHEVGDRLLTEVSQRLKACIRESDTLARPGGDEFIIILDELDELNSIERVANSILSSLALPFQLKNEICYVSLSIGITLFPDDAIVVDELVKKADQAMYAAKRQGGKRFCFFAPTMQAAADSRLRITNDLRKALANQQFWVAYQPIVDLATGDIHKAEALIRWQHPTQGLISPAEFIPIAEDTGMIVEIGEWVFHQAAKQVVKWRNKHHPLFQISVNKSPAQFESQHDNINGWFEHLQHLELPGASITVEITEGLLMDASSIVSEKLLTYRDTGMQVSLDDFGTGYSSMSYLKKFDIDYLKIDQSFVRNVTTDSTDRTLCETMIMMAHKLGMKVIAEGIETAEQRDFLMQAGCDYGQGYLFSRPVRVEEFEMLFQARNDTGL
jgi:diguanylate cyclase (GGDEF)-like protein/PAS domain S-box-containing protein